MSVAAAITAHALERWRERIDPAATREDVAALLDRPSVRAMLALGAGTVWLHDIPARVVIKGGSVVTVTGSPKRYQPPSRRHKRKLRAARRAREMERTPCG